MESELTSLLSDLPVSEYPTLSRYIEPHLTLIKSRTLNAFYRDLYCQKASSFCHISILVHDAIQDYRLRSVLERVIQFMVNQKNSYRR